MADKLIRELGLLGSGSIDGADWCEIQEDNTPATTITKKVTVTVLNEIERAARETQDNTIEAGVGLQADGTYDTPSGTNYLDATTDVMDALEALDGVLAGSGSGIQCYTVGVNAASLNNAWAAPYQIIAAPSANRSIDVIAVSIALDNNGTDLECANDKMVIQFDTGASHFVEWSNAFAESAADAIAKGTWTSNVTMLEAKKVELTFDGVANPTAGNTTLRVFITFRVVDLVPF